MDDMYFFDSYEQDKINELENTFIEKMKILMNVSSNRHNSVKYRTWKIGVFINRFIFRGRLSNVITVYRFNPTDEFLYIEKLCFTYYPNNMLLRVICYAFDIKTTKEFEKFIRVLTAAAVSLV